MGHATVPSVQNSDATNDPRACGQFVIDDREASYNSSAYLNCNGESIVHGVRRGRAAGMIQKADPLRKTIFEAVRARVG